MSNDPTLSFVQTIAKNMNNLESCRQLCASELTNANPETSVISASLLWLCTDIHSYLLDYEEQIERYGLSSDAEWRRITENVLGVFSKSVSYNDRTNSIEARLQLIQQFILAWVNFPKEDFDNL